MIAIAIRTVQRVRVSLLLVISLAAVSYSTFVCAQTAGDNTAPAAPAAQAVTPLPRPGDPFGPGHSRFERDGLQYVKGSMSFPSGVLGSDGLLLEKIVPAEIMLGRTFVYEYRVSNLTDYLIQQVRVVDEISPNFQLVEARPEPSRVDGKTISWNLGALAGKESKLIRVQGKSGQEGTVTTCGWATYRPVLCESIRIVKAAIQLTKNGPQEASLCASIPYRITVTNSGTSALTNVRVLDRLDEGLTVDGKREAVIEVGRLEPGESRDLNVEAQAAVVGRFKNVATVTSAQGAEAEASVVTKVTSPGLAVTCDAPAERYIGRPIDVCFTVSNTGNGVAANTVVTAVIPEETEFAGANGGGQRDGDQVVWRVGALAAEESRTLCARFTKSSRARLEFTATAVCDCVDPVTAVCATTVSGVHGVLLEVIDLEDPVEVGRRETYRIFVINQGTAEATKIRITCELEESQEFVTASGATSGTLRGNKVEFAPLAQLPPKRRATWEVVVRALKVDDVRFRVSLTSDQMDRPVDESEATNQY